MPRQPFILLSKIILGLELTSWENKVIRQWSSKNEQIGYLFKKVKSGQITTLHLIRYGEIDSDQLFRITLEKIQKSKKGNGKMLKLSQ